MHPHFTPSILERFWSKVDKDGPVPAHRPELGSCWVWTAGKFPAGYGSFCIENRDRGAHRYSYEATHGSIPDGLFVCHACDNPACVRPDHLFAATQKVNTHDCYVKGRKACGEKSPRSRVTAAQVAEIRANTTDTFTQMGRTYGISRVEIARIVKRTVWKDPPIA